MKKDFVLVNRFFNNPLFNDISFEFPKNAHDFYKVHSNLAPFSLL